MKYGLTAIILLLSGIAFSNQDPQTAWNEIYRRENEYRMMQAQEAQARALQQQLFEQRLREINNPYRR